MRWRHLLAFSLGRGVIYLADADSAVSPPDFVSSESVTMPQPILRRSKRLDNKRLRRKLQFQAVHSVQFTRLANIRFVHRDQAGCDPTTDKSAVRFRDPHSSPSLTTSPSPSPSPSPPSSVSTRATSLRVSSSRPAFVRLIAPSHSHRSAALCAPRSTSAWERNNQSRRKMFTKSLKILVAPTSLKCTSRHWGSRARYASSSCSSYAWGWRPSSFAPDAAAISSRSLSRGRLHTRWRSRRRRLWGTRLSRRQWVWPRLRHISWLWWRPWSRPPRSPASHTSHSRILVSLRSRRAALHLGLLLWKKAPPGPWGLVYVQQLLAPTRG